MATLMNGLPKVVFSQSLSEVNWNNARIAYADGCVSQVFRLA